MATPFGAKGVVILLKGDIIREKGCSPPPKPIYSVYLNTKPDHSASSFLLQLHQR